jgi:hypothetical protein
MVVIRGRLEPDVGAVLRQALDAAREVLYQRARGSDAGAGMINKIVPAETFPADVSAEPPTMAQQQAAALGLLAEPVLHHGIEPGAPGERYQVVVHVDAPLLTDPDAPGQSVLDDGVHVSAETSRRLACDATRVVMHHDPDGRVKEVGARTRTIPPALRRRMAAPPRCRISRCCVAGTTGRFTRPAIGWNDSLTGSCASGDRTVDYCPTCRRPPSFPPTPSTRGRRCPAGSESASTSATP